jgi:AcrR family transcriptional regulator
VEEQSRIDSDRDRLRAALIALVADRGFRDVTVELLLDAAGVDHATFQRHFASLDACFIDVWEGLTQEFLESTGGAYAAAGNWRDGVRAAGWAYCRFLQDDRARARYLIELSFGSELVRANRDFVMNSYAELVHLGRLEREQAAEVPRERAEGIVGAIWERIAQTVMADRFDDFPAATVELMYVTVLPYLGAEAAREELRRGPADIARYERGEL